MYVGRSYKLVDFALWSRRSVIYMVVVSGLAIAAYRFPATAGFSVPWSVVLVLGTTVSLKLMDYQALVDADVNALHVVEALAIDLGLTAGTYKDVLQTEITYGKFLNALTKTTGL